MIVYGLIKSPIGLLIAKADQSFLYEVNYIDPKEKVKEEILSDIEIANHPVLGMLKEQIEAYFLGKLRAFNLPLKEEFGTSFQKEVWNGLKTIPYGETRSYKELAEQIGRPKAVRALGGANGRNPFSIIVPCHRVIAADGSLGGYTGGLDKKEYLLCLEKENVKK